MAEMLMLSLGTKTFESGNFIVANALEPDTPISFVSEGFTVLTGA
jgi:hypothetical protein